MKMSGDENPITPCPCCGSVEVVFEPWTDAAICAGCGSKPRDLKSIPRISSEGDRRKFRLLQGGLTQSAYFMIHARQDRSNPTSMLI